MLEVFNIHKGYDEKVLKGVSFHLKKGHSYSLVGKSGCGKSTLSRIISGIEKPDEGQVLYNGQDIHRTKKKAYKDIQKNIQIVFQDAFSSLNPRWSIYKSIKEPIDNFEKLDNQVYQHRIHQLIETVGLDSSVLDRYPSELSGGQQKESVSLGLLLAIQNSLFSMNQ